MLCFVKFVISASFFGNYGPATFSAKYLLEFIPEILSFLYLLCVCVSACHQKIFSFVNINMCIYLYIIVVYGQNFMAFVVDVLCIVGCVVEKT